MKALSDNSSDKIVFIETIKELCVPITEYINWYISNPCNYMRHL